MTKRDKLHAMQGYTAAMRRQGYPQLDMEAPAIPEGYRVRVGVTFGRGDKDCHKCYMPLGGDHADRP